MNIMLLRRVCMAWKEAARNTIVPPTYFDVHNMKRYNAMRVMAAALPNLQQITLGTLGGGQKYNDGEDPIGEWSDGEDPDRLFAPFGYTDRTAHDIEIISNFSKLRFLEINHSASLNGRYPFLFSSFPLLQKLSITYCKYLKWDLEMLSGLPVLKELVCYSDPRLTGNISSLRALKDTLEKVYIGCDNVVGNFMDLADFPHLKELKLYGTAFTGDIREIGETDFSSLEQLTLPNGVYGGMGYVLQRITAGHDLMRAVYLLKKQRPALKMQDIIYWELSEDSPDWYEAVNWKSPPFCIYFVKAGSRVGYQWKASRYLNSCEVKWLDQEPGSESIGYEKYIAESQKLDRMVELYRGFHHPPTEEEYHRLVDG